MSAAAGDDSGVAVSTGSDSSDTVLAGGANKLQSTVSLDSGDTRRRGGGSDTQGRGGRVVVALPSPLRPAATAQLTRSGSLGLSNFRG